MKRHKVGKKRKKLKTNKDDVKTWRDLVFWRDLLLYFLAFSYVGHFIEMAWAWLAHVVLGRELMTNILHNPLEPYTIYGMGAVLVILIVKPLVKKLNHHIVATFVVATLVCAVLECVSSMILVWRHGYNPYWWYVDQPFNFYGHICLINSLLFGLLATVFLRAIYPLTEKLLRRSNQVVLNIVLLVLLAMFAVYYAGRYGLI
ncbi:putative ABC transporter permease [Candidatus Saccharibacteria bacterium]|nr:putative ABC transporter permease [Candidatus Saccharibacteria bacterium]